LDCLGLQPKGVTDPVIATMCALVMAVIAAIAAYVPSRRATGIDLAIALRHE
jgi:ABC-type antimicrobial peptide transport system permease subunit